MTGAAGEAAAAGEPAPGWIEPRVAEEFPELRLWWMTLPGGLGGRSPDGVRVRLREMSSRFAGAQAVMLRQQPVVHAYRVFFRHIGVDPDVDRVPMEALAVERLRAGGFRSRSVLEDALTIALMETHVGVWAVDADTLEGGLGIRQALHGEPLGRGDEYADRMRAGRLVVADGAAPVAELFGAPVAHNAVGKRTRRTVIYAVQVAGVPAIHVSEALWLVADNVCGDG